MCKNAQYMTQSQTLFKVLKLMTGVCWSEYARWTEGKLVWPVWPPAEKVSEPVLWVYLCTKQFFSYMMLKDRTYRRQVSCPSEPSYWHRSTSPYTSTQCRTPLRKKYYNHKRGAWLLLHRWVHHALSIHVRYLYVEVWGSRRIYTKS